MKKRETCSNCGAMASVTRGNYQSMDFGLPVELMRIELVQCSKCGNIDPIIPNMDDLMHAIAFALVCNPCKLSGEHVRFLRKYLGKTAKEFAQLVHYKDHTHLSKIENGHEEIGPQADKLVRFVVIDSSPELKSRVNELLEMLPGISDDCSDTAEIKIDPETNQVEYA